MRTDPAIPLVLVSDLLFQTVYLSALYTKPDLFKLFMLHLDSLVLLNLAIVKIDGDALIEKCDVLKGRVFCRLMWRVPSGSW